MNIYKDNTCLNALRESSGTIQIVLYATSPLCCQKTTTTTMNNLPVVKWTQKNYRNGANSN